MSANKPYPSILQGFLLIIPILGFGLLFFLGYKIFVTQFDISTLSKPVLLDVLYVAVFAAITWLAYRRRKRSGLKGLNLSMVPVRVLVVGIIAAFCMDLMLELFYYYFPPGNDFLHEMNEMINGGVLSVLTAVVAAPVFEEVLMRGIILDGFLKRYKPTTAIFWSALIFAAFHFNIWQGVSAFAFGLLAGWLYWKSGSLLLCILMHAFGNGLVVVLSKMDSSESVPLPEDIGMGNYMLLFVVAFIVLAGCLWYLNGYFNKRRESVDEIRPEQAL